MQVRRVEDSKTAKTTPAEPKRHRRDPESKKFIPVTDTKEPPRNGPPRGSREITTGRLIYVNWISFDVKSCPLAVTSTATAVLAPARCPTAGALQTMELALLPGTNVAGTTLEPNLHAFNCDALPPASKFVPCTVTCVPP